MLQETDAQVGGVELKSQSFAWPGQPSPSQSPSDIWGIRQWLYSTGQPAHQAGQHQGAQSCW